jgi:hypothetical protein
MKNDLSHLAALQTCLSHERVRLAQVTRANNLKQIALRTVWVAQYEREIAAEYDFLGIDPNVDCDLSDDELLAELSA